MALCYYRWFYLAGPCKLLASYVMQIFRQVGDVGECVLERWCSEV